MVPSSSLKGPQRGVANNDSSQNVATDSELAALDGSDVPFEPDPSFLKRVYQDRKRTIPKPRHGRSVVHLPPTFDDAGENDDRDRDDEAYGVEKDDDGDIESMSGDTRDTTTPKRTVARKRGRPKGKREASFGSATTCVKGVKEKHEDTPTLGLRRSSRVPSQSPNIRLAKRTVCPEHLWFYSYSIILLGQRRGETLTHVVG
ncbi:hypothetical protein F5Y08DRAFT_244387 [Xylaria arbuscula]|nr:hypothetical protein F5Y08DRAFT_244387 [Xylaria arbuscula]